jgi:hypothetical protein
MTESVFHQPVNQVAPGSPPPLEKTRTDLPVSVTARVHEAERAVLQLKPDERAAALCLSGGGIRSAAFCLGVLQAFAARKLLRQFHYLSTVSGGGYIGGWLTRCIAEQHQLTACKGNCCVETVEDLVLAPRSTPEQPEAPQLSRLRRYTNYLTPHAGLTTTDASAGATLWVRNTLINWAVLLPLMLAVAAVPILYVVAVCWVAGLRIADPAHVADIAGAAGLLCLFIGVYRTCLNLPSFVSLRRPQDRASLNGPKIKTTIVYWTLAWAFLVPLAFAPLLQPQEAAGPVLATFHWTADKPAAPDGCAIGNRCSDGRGGLTTAAAGRREETSPFRLMRLPALAFGVCAGAYALARAWIRWRHDKPVPAADDHEPSPRRFHFTVVRWWASSALSALVLWLGAWLAMHFKAGVFWIAIAGPVWVVGAEMLRSGAFSALHRDGLCSDLDREWLARLSAEKWRIVLALGALGTASVFLPTVVLDNRFGFASGAAAFLSGPAAAWLGQSARTAFSQSAKADTRQTLVPLDWIAGICTALFGVTLFMLFGRLVVLAGEPVAAMLRSAETLPWTQDNIAPWLPPMHSSGVRFGIAFCTGVPAALLLFYFARFIDGAVNLNRFSMHAVYRNRLVRGFLGSARDPAERKPDQFTEFDPADNIRVYDTFPRDAHTEDKRTSMFPVINVSLNRTSGQDTARAERMAEPFTITPLHCGSAFLGQGQGRREGAYVPTQFFAGGAQETGKGDKQNGITLGTAMTLSGAAVSPHMGYHSSPYTAFVMTLFNVRLGAWLPNPGMTKQPPEKHTMNRAGPDRGIQAMIQDLLGDADDQDDFIYLSDGGHFDNLGLYEMLSRRCGRIVVVDADEDPDFGYEDLSRTLQHALIDLGVRVDFAEPLLFGSKDKPGETKLRPHGAYATIHYADDPPDAPSGELIFIKPWLPDDAPAELKAFKVLKKAFPHDPTKNQFFTESDFESYRRLGEYLAGTVLKLASAPGNHEGMLALPDLMSGVRRLARQSSVKGQVASWLAPVSHLFKYTAHPSETVP